MNTPHKCQQEDICEVEDTGRCFYKGLFYINCDYYQGVPAGGEIAVADHTLLPWTGRVLTPMTLPLISGLRRPQIVTLVGLPKSGKTSFLTSAFMRLRHQKMSNFTFAGSLTLAGWALLSKYADWSTGIPQTFPPRTSSDRRDAGFLHLALRDTEDHLIDLALADAPGEWFEEWVMFDPEDTTLAHPAGWLTAHSDTVLFFVNTPAFYDALESNVVLDETLNLADRVAAAHPHKVMVIYAQKDATPEKESVHLNDLKKHLQAIFPAHQAFATKSVWCGGRGEGILEALAEAMIQPESRMPNQDPPHADVLAGWLRGQS